MTKTEGSVEKAYEALRAKAINFEFKPGERLNETALTKTLDVSRTPLREALNRLVAEGFLTFVLGKGFFCRPLSPQKILELYQLRCALETEALLRTIESASDQDILDVVTYLDRAEEKYVTTTDLAELLRMDEEFHMKLAALSGNEELVRLLENVNERIRYVRIINLRLLRDRRDMKTNDHESLSAHRIILNAAKARDSGAAIKALRSHIERRSEQTVELVQVAFSQLYVPDV
jgi:DNA-binding GntR family transcriptional regulator